MQLLPLRSVSIFLTLSASVILLACPTRPDAPSTPEFDVPHGPAWEVMSEEDKLLYQEAVTQGFSRHPDIQKMMVTTFLHERVYPQLEETELQEDELKKFFEEHRDSFATPARVHLRRILLTPSEELSEEQVKGKALQLHRQVTEDTSQFSTLARKHSDGPYGLQGGDVGFLTVAGKGGVATSAVDQAFAATPGAPPVLVQTEEGWNIFWVPEATERVEPNFNTVRHTVLRRLKAARHRALYSAYLDGLKTAAESQE